MDKDVDEYIDVEQNLINRLSLTVKIVSKSVQCLLLTDFETFFRFCGKPSIKFS